MQTGVKQGCVLAPALFALFFVAMLTEINHCVKGRGVSVQYRIDGKKILQHLEIYGKTQHINYKVS